MKAVADSTGWSAVDYAGVNGNQVRSALAALDVAFDDRRARGGADEELLIADIGCGAGEVALELAGRGHRVHASDNSPSMVESTRRRCAEHDGRVIVDRRDAGVLELEPGRYDVVHSSWTLHWIPDIRPLLGTIVRALRPGGYVVLQWNAGQPADEPEGQFGILREVAERPRWRDRLAAAPFVMRRHPSDEVVADLTSGGLEVIARIDDMVIPPPPDAPPMTLVDVRERVKRTGMGLQMQALGAELDGFLDEAIAVMVERKATSLRDSRIVARRTDDGRP